MSNKTTITDAVFEQTTPRFTAVIQDEDGVGFKPDALTFTLYDVETGAIVNERSAVDILSSCDADGNIQFWLARADVSVVAPRAGKTQETRRALLRWNWASDRYGAHEVEFTVEDNSQVS